MTRHAPLAGLAAALLLALPLTALAQDRVGLRLGNHPGFGRVVFDWRSAPEYGVELVGDRLRLRFPAGTALDLAAGPRAWPRNVVGLEATAGTVEIALRPGTRARHFRHGPAVVVDLMDPAPARVAPLPQAAEVQPTLPTVPDGAVAAQAAGRSGSGTAAGPAPPEPAVLPAQEPAGPPATVTLPDAAALPVQLAAGPKPDRALRLPFGPETGAALLRRGDTVLAVFDRALPLDLAALRGDPVFAGLEAVPLHGATLLRLRLDPPAELVARRDATGWRLEPVRPGAAAGAPERSLVLQVEPGTLPGLALPVAQPGRVVPLADPDTGLPLLVGTVLEPGQRMPHTRRIPELDLVATGLGVAVLARADSVVLRAGSDRFVLAGTGSTDLGLGGPLLAPDPIGAGTTRAFDLPALPPARLLDRLRLLQAEIAAAPPLGRLPQRRAAAETMLALGMPQEAQAMLGLALAEDPQAAAAPEVVALAGAAALLAGRLGEAGALHAAVLPESDERTLWRAALLAARGDARGAAPGLVATLPLLLDYPEPLRARLRPLAAQALGEAGERHALQHLLSATAAPAPDLALPRAILAELEGRAEDALAAYDAVAGGRDRLARARALRRGIELRLATGRMEPAAAAQALDAALFAWRGDAEEVAARRRLARLRLETGAARGALSLLQETVAWFPDMAATLRPEVAASFRAALEQEPPLAAIALFDAAPASLAPEALSDAALLLTDRLLALDLPDRAAALLREALERGQGAERARLGARLAALRLSEGDAAGALEALDATRAAGLPGAMERERTLVAARAQARRGQLEPALKRLDALGTEGLLPRSELLADVQDWSGAAAALAAHLHAAMTPATAPPAEDHSRLLVRQAALLALAGDESALAALRNDRAGHLRDGASAEAFALLTADPLRGLADLPRLQRELQLFRNIPSRLEALRSGAPVTR